MRAGDIGVVELFHEDAELRGLGMITRGKEEIRNFYQGVIDNAGPSPTELDPKIVKGNRVFAEILIHIGDDISIHAVDVFEIVDNRIKSLTYFTADYPGE
jgi:hypothetical protein